MKRAIHILLCANFLLLIYSCDNSQYLFRENTSVDNEVWNVKTQIPFRFTVSDTTQIYKIGFNIRYTYSYPQQNLYVFLHTVFPNGMRTHDTLSVDLFSIEGKAFGKGRGALELQHYFARVRFPMAGEYIMNLEQAMRMDSLPGVMSMGLYISKFENTKSNGK